MIQPQANGWQLVGRSAWGVAPLNPRLIASIPTGMPRLAFISKGFEPLALGRASRTQGTRLDGVFISS